MQIVVCLKHVPAQTDVRVDQTTGQLKTEGIAWVVNPWDEYAVEEAIRIKEKIPGSTVTALTFGGPDASKALEYAIQLGADAGILVTDPAAEGSDAVATARILAAAVAKIGKPELIFCGRHATDGNTGQSGPALAELLGIPHVAFVKKIEDVQPTSARVQRSTEEGYDVLEAKLPLLLTVVKEINEPRLPSLKGKMAAKKAVFPHWSLSDLGLKPEQVGAKGSATAIVKQWAPPARPKGEAIPGKPQEKAAALVKKLRERGLI